MTHHALRQLLFVLLICTIYQVALASKLSKQDLCCKCCCNCLERCKNAPRTEDPPYQEKESGDFYYKAGEGGREREGDRSEGDYGREGEGKRGGGGRRESVEWKRVTEWSKRTRDDADSCETKEDEDAKDESAQEDRYGDDREEQQVKRYGDIAYSDKGEESGSAYDWKLGGRGRGEEVDDERKSKTDYDLNEEDIYAEEKQIYTRPYTARRFVGGKDYFYGFYGPYDKSREVYLSKPDVYERRPIDRVYPIRRERKYLKNCRRIVNPLSTNFVGKFEVKVCFPSQAVDVIRYKSPRY